MKARVDNLRETYPTARSSLTGNVFQMVGTILQNKEYSPKGHPKFPLPRGMKSLSQSFI